MQVLGERVARLLAQDGPAVRVPAQRFVSCDVAADGGPGGVYPLPDYANLAVQQSASADDNCSSAQRETSDVLRLYVPSKIGGADLFLNMWTLAPCARPPPDPYRRCFPHEQYLEVQTGLSYVRIMEAPGNVRHLQFNRNFGRVTKVLRVPNTEYFAFVTLTYPLSHLRICDKDDTVYSPLSVFVDNDDDIVDYFFRGDGAIFVQTRKTFYLLR